MSRIKIKNFGPIKGGFQGNDGWLDVKKVTVFVGNQGSGKSTITKLISTFVWIEKALVRGDYDKKWFERKDTNRFKSQFLPYHRLGAADKNKDDTYLKANSVIEYQGDAYHIKYENGVMSITETSSGIYPLPQVMYVPAERNFLTYIKDAGELRLSSALRDFNTEYDKAKNNLKDLFLPINNVEVEYNKQYGNLYLRGEDYKIEITDAASGFQSFVPLYLVSSFLAKSVQQSASKETMSSKEKLRFEKGVQDIWNNKSLTDEQRTVALSALSSKFNKSSFVNIVEEPEQNLFPSSQWEMLQCLLEFNNMNAGNKLVFTTHSPYLISYLTLLVKAGQLNSKIKTDEYLKSELEKIVSLNSIIDSEDLLIYELDENNGTIYSLETYNGLPSDENKLNEKLDEGNELFAKLLDIQKQL